MKSESEFNEIKIRHAALIYLLDFVIFFILVSYIVKLYGEISNTYINILCLIATALALFMFLYKIKPSIKKISLLYIDFKNKIDMKEIIYVSMFFIFLNIGGANVITDIIYLISPAFANGFIKDSVLTVNSIIDYVICFIILVVLAPIVDEITFRYILFKRLSKRFNVYVGLIVSAVIFSAINICPEIFGNFALGIVNCILYVKYENILMPILVYAIYNFLDMFFIKSIIGFNYTILTMNVNTMILSLIIGLLLFFIGVQFFVKYASENRIYLKGSFR
ncbi:type II CAAX endopeptidase family protein [Clostridium sp. YIM B02555]|uniref:CPBP family intramembrane glutamic endopeptidase n=1 Tax=Clostridium sp. YIM B02555 TaxID=2911968 RepID=UPI001EEE8F30|nr:type II CAAX endopeptidase family protein [Clostridium sp. YIM B02555]